MGNGEMGDRGSGEVGRWGDGRKKLSPVSCLLMAN